MSTVFVSGSKENRPDPPAPASSALVHERRHHVVFSPVDTPDYEPSVAAAFRRLGAEYDDLACKLFDGDPDLTTDIWPSPPTGLEHAQDE